MSIFLYQQSCSLCPFGKAAYLTVSGQLEGEAFACALSNIWLMTSTNSTKIMYILILPVGWQKSSENNR